MGRPGCQRTRPVGGTGARGDNAIDAAAVAVPRDLCSRGVVAVQRRRLRRRLMNTDTRSFVQ